MKNALTTTPGAGFTKPLRLTKAGISDYGMHFVYALVRKSSFSKTQGFVKPAPVLQYYDSKKPACIQGLACYKMDFRWCMRIGH